MLYACTNMEREQLGALQALEQEIGKTLIALTPIDSGPAEVAEPELDKIKALEERLGVLLVAVEG